MEFVLGDVGRLIFVCGAASFVVFAVIIVICCVSPSCCIYRHMHPEEMKEDLLKGSAETRKRALYGAEVVLAEFPHPTDMKPHEAQLSKRVSNASSSSSAYSSRHSASSIGSSNAAASLRDSIYSAHDGPAATCNVETEQINGSMSYNNGPHRLAEEGEEEPNMDPHVAPEVTLTLQLTLPVSEQPEQCRLHVTVMEARKLPPRDYGSGAADVYLTVNVTRSGTMYGTLLEARTRTVRRATSPNFQETFSADIRRVDLKDSCIEITAVDQDRHANSSVLCRGSLDLSTLTDKLTSATGPYQAILPLQPCREAKGDCLISVTWLPTAQRVSFSVMRIQGLQKHHSGPLNPYVRIIQLSSLGRSLKRKKTPPATVRITDSADTASFPETLSFDVPPLQAESATFLVTLWHRVTPVHHNSSSDDTSSEPDVTPDVCLGKIALGRAVRGTAERLHWLSVLQNPRKVITHWHALH